MRLITAAVLVICTVCQPLTACINDSATQVDEQQFVSAYDQRGQPRSRSPVGVQISTFNPSALLLLVPSLALVGVAILWLRQERALAKNPRQQSHSQQG